MQKQDAIEPLSGKWLWIAAILLSASNFIVVLDMTVANVSVSHIAGSLAISMTEGTYVITSYAVAEAITVPLTGWLAKRFGTVRVFTTCMILFGFFSILCGSSQSLTALVMGRICQGLVGGPLMPLSQTLLMHVFPIEKRSTAIGLWAMTTMIAPVMGPIVGGYICDNWGWGIIFYINIPIAILCSIGNSNLLKRFETKIIKEKIDKVGFLLMMIWIAALQIMLDEGKNYDWFESKLICCLAVVAIVGFISFLIWELTQENPIVDLRVFRHRGYSVCVLTISIAFGGFFGAVVLTPLWLQNFMGYTATTSGYVMAASGILSIFIAPIVAKLTNKVDLRWLVFSGIMWLCFVTISRAFYTTDATFAQIAIPLLFQGIGTPFFFIPLTALALSSVNIEETSSAAGLMSFLRTLSGAFSTSIITTYWENHANLIRTDLVGLLSTNNFPTEMQNDASASYLLDTILQNQAIMLSTNHIFFIVAIVFCIAASSIWLAPRKKQI